MSPCQDNMFVSSTWISLNDLMPDALISPSSWKKTYVLWWQFQWYSLETFRRIISLITLTERQDKRSGFESGICEVWTVTFVHYTTAEYNESVANKPMICAWRVAQSFTLSRAPKKVTQLGSIQPCSGGHWQKCWKMYQMDFHELQLGQMSIDFEEAWV